MSANARPNIVAGLAAALCLTALAACGEGPSKSGIKDAVNEQLQKDPPMCWNVMDPNAKFPLRVATGPNKPLHPILAGLQKEGLVSVQPTQSEGFFSEPLLVVSLTPQGEAAKAWTPGQGFCVGRRGVDEVKDFTDPAPNNGVLMTQAHFTWTVVDLPAWAKRGDFAGVPGMAQPGEGQAILVKTNEGWKARQISTDLDAKDAAAAAGQ